MTLKFEAIFGMISLTCRTLISNRRLMYFRRKYKLGAINQINLMKYRRVTVGLDAAEDTQIIFTTSLVRGTRETSVLAPKN